MNGRNGELNAERTASARARRPVLIVAEIPEA